MGEVSEARIKQMAGFGYIITLLFRHVPSFEQHVSIVVPFSVKHVAPRSSGMPIPELVEIDARRE